MATTTTIPIEEQLAQAAVTCAKAGAKLTEIRRQVLALILSSRDPVGAYTLLDRLKPERANAAPVTVYRALDFLQAHGLIHKVERLNAFIGCSGPQARHDHDHPAQFLICTKCGSVAEMEDPGIAQAVARVAAKAGFRPAHATVEVEGSCAACAQG